jgi:hypothetical protein
MTEPDQTPGTSDALRRILLIQDGLLTTIGRINEFVDSLTDAQLVAVADDVRKMVRGVHAAAECCVDTAASLQAEKFEDALARILRDMTEPTNEGSDL